MDHDSPRIAVLREQLDQEMVPLFAASIIAYHEVSSDAREVRDEVSLDHIAHVSALALSSIAPIYAAGAKTPAGLIEVEALLRERRSSIALHSYSIRRGDLRMAIQKLRAARVTLTRDNQPRQPLPAAPRPA